ncbi:MAG: 30S ribosomal protein S2 [Planctomycetota bacterium]
MATITVDELLENGVHFGHRASRWNPKMKPYIHGRRNDIHIIDLKQTLKGLLRAAHVLENVVAEGGSVLWVGTKRSAREAVRGIAVRTRQPYVTERWLGGTLTNFRTIRSRLGRLNELEQLEESGTLALFKKKEQARLRTEHKKLRKNLDGIRDLEHLPAILVVVDPKNEHIAVAEANKMQIPVIAILDTDCDPDTVDIAIPANDDAMRSVRVLLNVLADGVDEGNKRWQVVVGEQQKQVEAQRREQEARREQERQRAEVTEQWQKRLREDAERKRRGPGEDSGESGDASSDDPQPVPGDAGSSEDAGTA